MAVLPLTLAPSRHQLPVGQEHGRTSQVIQWFALRHRRNRARNAFFRRSLVSFERWFVLSAFERREETDAQENASHGAWKGSELAIGHIIADALDNGEGAILLPDLPGFARELLVGFDLLLRYREHEPVDTGHVSVLSSGTTEGRLEERQSDRFPRFFFARRSSFPIPHDAAAFSSSTPPVATSVAGRSGYPM
jgi:hypothetical protein